MHSCTEVAYQPSHVGKLLMFSTGKLQVTNLKHIDSSVAVYFHYREVIRGDDPHLRSSIHLFVCLTGCMASNRNKHLQMCKPFAQRHTKVYNNRQKSDSFPGNHVHYFIYNLSKQGKQFGMD